MVLEMIIIRMEFLLFPNGVALFNPLYVWIRLTNQFIIRVFWTHQQLLWQHQRNLYFWRILTSLFMLDTNNWAIIEFFLNGIIAVINLFTERKISSFMDARMNYVYTTVECPWKRFVRSSYQKKLLQTRFILTINLSHVVSYHGTNKTITKKVFYRSSTFATLCALIKWALIDPFTSGIANQVHWGLWKY